MTQLRLRPMTGQEFDAFRAQATRGYADAQLEAGNWPPQEAQTLAEASFDELLPDGLGTDDVILAVGELADGTAIGHVWVALRGPFGGDEAWVYNIEVDERHRGHGHGRALLTAAERAVAARGITALGLNVFGDNAPARSLYESAGYATVSLRMRRTLDP